MNRPVVGMLTAVLAACTPEAPATPGASDATGPGGEAVAALPAGAPEQFGFGAHASEDRIALWDIDVKPDGE
ncbi:MAG: hypothetical protein OXI83_13495, partial [Gemmatimonadota bacterium]|nr:hypothetical protein [Gemmatimonadota bacterium]